MGVIWRADHQRIDLSISAERLKTVVTARRFGRLRERRLELRKVCQRNVHAALLGVEDSVYAGSAEQTRDAHVLLTYGAGTNNAELMTRLLCSVEILILLGNMLLPRRVFEETQPRFVDVRHTTPRETAPLWLQRLKRPLGAHTAPPERAIDRQQNQ